jgi:hypothetical protein
MKDGAIKLVIKSDGLSTNTHLCLSNGEKLEQVESVHWSIKVGEAAKCVLTMAAIPVELETDMESVEISRN